MSHVHLPDGVLPPLVWICGLAGSFAVLYLAVRHLKTSDIRRKIPFVGVIAALMLIFMSVPLGIIPVHLSLAVLCGILAGPALGFIAVFVVNMILAMMGHGGITVVGVNTLILGSEVFVGYYLFKALSFRMKSTPSAVMANIAALLVSTVMMVSIIGFTVGFAEVLPGHSDDGHADEAYSDIGGITDDIGDVDADIDMEVHTGDLQEAVQSYSYMSLSGWTAIGVVLMAGILTESLITGLIISFFSKVRPDLIGFAV